MNKPTLLESLSVIVIVEVAVPLAAIGPVPIMDEFTILGAASTAKVTEVDE